MPKRIYMFLAVDDFRALPTSPVRPFAMLLLNTSKDLSRMVSSGMLRRVALVRTDVSEELSAFFIRVT
jgi:hypothetical protein